MTTTQAALAAPLPAAATRASKAQLVTGRVLSGFAALFLLFDGTAKLLQVPQVLEASQQLGYPADVTFTLGVLLLGCLATYLVPRTSALGAILLTGYLGGAVATHVRVENPLFSHVLFPVYVAALIWGGLVLRDPAMRAILPTRKRA